MCPKPYRVKLWKPATCSVSCSMNFMYAPLEVRLHNLLIDPLALDLFLTAVYAAAGVTSTSTTSKLDLLPGCPIPQHQVRQVIDSYSPLSFYVNAADLKQAIGTDTMGRQRELLLSWICLRFRGFVMTAPSGYRVPSMPGVTQFIILNSAHDKEKSFNRAQFDLWLSPNTTGGPVFHGTALSRLFSILTSELKVMSQTPYKARRPASQTVVVQVGSTARYQTGACCLAANSQIGPQKALTW
jgi:hypothetical protein